jgi:hypothetical protein
MTQKPVPLTPGIIADMKPGGERADAKCAGLRVRCTSSARVFFYRYRARDGALRQIKLGEFGPLTLAAARVEVAKKRLQREQGVDPQIEKRKTRERERQERKVERDGAYTVARMIEDYDEEVLSKQKRGREGRRVLNDFEEKFKDRPAALITRRELLDELIRPKLKSAPRGATYLLSCIRCAYVHASEQGRLPDDFVSPTVGIKGAAQVRRRRAFTDAELATFLRWLPHSPYSRTVCEALSFGASHWLPLGRGGCGSVAGRGSRARRVDNSRDEERGAA